MDAFSLFLWIAGTYMVVSLVPWFKEMQDIKLDDAKMQNYGRFIFPIKKWEWAWLLVLEAPGLYFAIAVVLYFGFGGVWVYLKLGTVGQITACFLAGLVAWVYNQVVLPLMWYIVRQRAVRAKRRERGEAKDPGQE